jgi:predicted ribosomally synthesized peptide with nif11-like leader
MSLQSAKSYVDMIIEDSSFWKKHNNTKDKNQRDKIIRSEGYDFTEKDLDLAFSLVLNELKAQRSQSVFL